MRPSNFERRILSAYAAAAYLLLYTPIIVLALFSFNDSPLLTFPLRGLTFKWYAVLAVDHTIQRSIRNSFIVAGAVVPMTLVLGVPLAFALDRIRFPGK
jgi:spermidine/putrescine transport system permease protein